MLASMKKSLLAPLGLAAMSAALLASCGGGSSSVPPAPAPTVSTTAATVVAVLGDSVCAGYITTTPLAYVDDPAHAWPAAVAQTTGYTVDNLCVPGYGVNQVQQVEVAKIPPSANIIIYACGSDDFGSGSTWQTEKWALDALLPLIHAQAPNAKMIFLGVRPWMFDDGFFTTITAFNAYLAAIPGSRYIDDASSAEGTGFDVQSEWDQWDLHPTQAAVGKIAALVSASLTGGP
jgi:hypothetical protein